MSWVNNKTNNSSTYSLSYSNSPTYKLIQVFGYFIIPITATFGLFIYTAYAFILWQSNLTKRIRYNRLIYKVLNIALIYILFIGYQNSRCTFCQDRLYTTYVSQAYNTYVTKYGFHILSMTQGVLEILMVFDRFCILKSVQSNLLKIPTIYIYFSCLLIFAVVRSPDIFAYDINYSPANGTYYITNSKAYKWYFIYITTVNIIFYSTCLTGSLVVIVLNIIAFREWATYKAKIVANKTNIEKAEAAFTRMITLASIILTFAVVYNVIAFILIYFVRNLLDEAIINLNYQISYELILLGYISDVLIYISLDRNLKINL